MAKKLSTKDILAAARAEVGKSSGDDAEKEEPSAAQPAEAETNDSAAAEEKPAAKATPTSTKDILAAARAEAGTKSDAPTSESSEKPKAAEKPAASGAPPKSTKDIMAKLRAEVAGGPKETESPKPATAKAGAKAAPSLPEGEKPSVQEMLKAVREGKPAEAKTPAKPRLPTRPPKPAAAKPVSKDKGSRRNFLTRMLTVPFIAAWVFFTGATVVFLAGCARFMMPNTLVEPPTNFKIGPPTDYPLGAVSTKWKAQFGVWIVHVVYEGKNLIYALFSVCTHLGCTPNWLEGEQKFKCPCHGSGFYKDGVNFEGPAPRPLERAGIRLAEDGMLEVDKSVKFQQELGQWEDPASFVEVA